MIAFEKTYKERQCNCCFGKNDVIEVVFRSDIVKQGTAIALCKDCRKKLYKMIKDKDVDPAPVVDAVPYEIVKEWFEEIGKKVNLLFEKVGCNAEQKDGEQ